MNKHLELTETTELLRWIPISEQTPPLMEETPETDGFFLLFRDNKIFLWFGSVPIDSTHWAKIPPFPNKSVKCKDCGAFDATNCSISLSEARRIALEAVDQNPFLTHKDLARSLVTSSFLLLSKALGSLEIVESRTMRKLNVSEK